MCHLSESQIARLITPMSSGGLASIVNTRNKDTFTNNFNLHEIFKVPLTRGARGVGGFRGLAVYWECPIDSKLYYK